MKHRRLKYVARAGVLVPADKAAAMHINDRGASALQRVQVCIQASRVGYRVRIRNVDFASEFLRRINHNGGNAPKECCNIDD